MKSSSIRKKESIKILKEMNIDYNEDLPEVEDSTRVTLKSLKQITERIFACFASIELAYDINNGICFEQAKKKATEFLEKYNVEEKLTKKEKQLFNNKKKFAIDISWKIEACITLVWALGFIEKLPFPDLTVDIEILEELFERYDDFESFIEFAEIKDIEEILDEVDLEYRYHWACVEKENINSETKIGDLYSDVVLERRRALEWLISNNNEWDEIALDT